MSKRTNILLGLAFAVAWGLLWRLVFANTANAVFNGICLLAGWFADDAIRWLRKRKTA